MAELVVYKIPRQRRLAFRAMIVDVFMELTDANAKFLTVVYDEKRSFSDFTELADLFLMRHSIQNCRSWGKP